MLSRIKGKPNRLIVKSGVDLNEASFSYSDFDWRYFDSRQDNIGSEGDVKNVNFTDQFVNSSFSIPYVYAMEVNRNCRHPLFVGSKSYLRSMNNYLWTMRGNELIPGEFNGTAQQKNLGKSQQ
jgi:hypothetical protein